MATVKELREAAKKKKVDRVLTSVNSGETKVKDLRSAPSAQKYREEQAAAAAAPKVTTRSRAGVPEGYDAAEGRSGWVRYQHDKIERQREKRQAESEKSWFEKVGELLGEAQSMTMTMSDMPGGVNMYNIVESYRNDNTYLQPGSDWNDEERDIFGFLWDKGDTALAYDYAEKVNEAINQEKKAAEAAKLQEKVRSDIDHVGLGAGIAHTAASIAAAPTGLADFLDAAAQYAATGQVRTRGSLTPFEYSELARETIAEDLNEKSGTLAQEIPIIGGKGLGDLYNLGTSIAQSGFAAYTGGQVGTLVQFFGSSSASSMYDALERGASGGQALAMGAIGGIAEAVPEMLSVDKLLRIGSSTTMRELLQNVAKQGLSEGLEEGATTLINNFADQLVMADKSNFYLTVAELKKAGYTEEGAKWQAWKMMANDLAYDVVAGAASGAIHAGGQTGVQTLLGVQDAKRVYGENGPELVQEGLSMKGGSSARAVAEENRPTVDAGETMDGWQLYRQSLANEQTKYAAAAEQKLAELGETGDAAALASALAKEAYGRPMTRAEARLVKSSANADAVREALADTNSEEYGRLVQAAYAEEEEEAAQTAQDGAEAAKIPGGEFATEEENADEARKSAATEEMAAPMAGTVNEKAEERLAGPAQADVSAAEEGQGAPAVSIEAVAEAYGPQAEAVKKVYSLGGGGQSAERFSEAFSLAYDMGRVGGETERQIAMTSPSTRYLTQQQRESAFAIGADAATAAVRGRGEAIRAAATASTARRKGVVKSEGVTMKELKAAFNDTQKKAYKLLSTFAEATGIDIVLYRSAFDEEGNAVDAQGRYDRSAPGTLYLDINAGINNIGSVEELGKYTVMRTFSHEFMHFLENWNPEKYQTFRQAVLDTMKENGTDVEALIGVRMEKTGLGHEAASREVVAEAMTDIMPQASFMEKLVERDKSLAEKLIEKLKAFIRELKEYFAAIGSNPSREAAAVKREIDGALRYADSIVELYDNLALEAVENYQKTTKAGESKAAYDRRVGGENGTQNMARGKEEFETKGVHWILEIEGMTKADARFVWETVANITKRGYNGYVETVDGEYIADNGNKIFFIKADYNYPEVSRVIVLDDEYETNMFEAKELISDAEGDAARHREAMRTIALSQGEEYAVEYENPTASSDGRKNRRGKRTNRGGNSGTSGGGVTQYQLREPESKERVSYRYVRKEKGVMSAWGHALFADSQYAAESYGENVYTVKHEKLSDIEKYMEEIEKAIEEDYENGTLPQDMVDQITSGATFSEMAKSFNPEDIVMSAEAWDNGDMMQWFYERVADPNGLYGIKTADGAVVFDEDLIEYNGNWREDSSTTQKQDRGAEALTDEEALEMMAEGVFGTEQMTEGQWEALQIYKKRLDALRELQAKRREQGQIFHRNQFGPGGDKREAKAARNRMEVLDGQIRKAGEKLLQAGEKTVLRDVLKEARAAAEKLERKRSGEELARWRDRRDNAERIRALQKRIKKDVSAMAEWNLHPNNKDQLKHMPEALRKTVIPFLQSLDFEDPGARKYTTRENKALAEKLRKMTQAFEDKDIRQIYNNYEVPLPEAVIERMKTLQALAESYVETGEKSYIISRMTADELENLAALVGNLKAIVQNFNRLHETAAFSHLTGIGNSSVGYMREMAPAKNTNAITQYLFWQQMRPAYAFERFGEGGVAIYNALRRGQDKLAFNAKEIIDFAEKTYTNEEVKAWEKEFKDIKLSDGSTVRMSAAQIMSFYELSKRKQAVGHILGKGIRVATVKEKGKKISDEGHLITKADVENIIGALSERQKEVADALQRFMQEKGSEWGNYVSMTLWGEAQFGEENYFPIYSDGRHLRADADEKPGQASLYALLNMGFTKQTDDNAKNRLMIYSAFDVFANHMVSVAQYNALALPVSDALRWFNYRETVEGAGGKVELGGGVREEMVRVYGAPEEKTGKTAQGYAETFVLNIIRSFNGTEGQGSKFDSFGLKSLSRYNRAQVAFNGRVVIQQPLAITRAGMVLGEKAIAKGIAATPGKLKATVEKMRKYSGIAAWKDLGFYDVNISRGLTTLIKHDETLAQKTVDKGLAAAGKADELTWAAIWNACEAQVQEKQKLTAADGKRFYEAVTELFEEVVYKTQVVDSTLTKNEFMRAPGGLAKVLGSFMSEPTTTLSMLLDSYEKYRRDIQRGMTPTEAWKKHGKNIGRTLYIYGAGAVALAAVQALADAWRDDDDYQSFLEKWEEAFKGNVVDELMPLNKIPVVSDVYEMVKQLGADWFGWDTYGSPPASVIGQGYDQLLKGGQIISDKINGKDTNYTWWGGVYKLLQAASGIVGLPIAALTREVVTVWNNTGGTWWDKKLKTYDPGEKNSIKYAYKDGYLSEEEAMQLLLEQEVAKTEDEAYWFIQEWDSEEENYSKYTEVYEAVREGEDVEKAMEKLVEHGYTEKEVLSQVKSQIGRWYREGEISEQQVEEMLSGDHFSITADEAKETVARWKCTVETGIDYNDIAEELTRGNLTSAKAKQMYRIYGGLSEAEAEEKVNGIVFRAKNPEAGEISDAAVAKYNKHCKSTRIPESVYFKAWQHKNSLTGSGDVQAKMIAYINKLPLTPAQKDALFLALGWSEKSLGKTGWH